MHRTEDLIQIFHKTFYQRYRTRLVKGDHEPIYLPADTTDPDHRIIFAHGFYASALHEIAHWLVAGQQRRLQEDLGYWYQPDGRNAEQQAVFEAVEVKPQAIEWLLCVAAGFPFNVSCDNLSGAQPDRVGFQHQVYQQVERLLQKGTNQRVQLFIHALADFYRVPLPLSIVAFQFDQLDKTRLAS